MKPETAGCCFLPEKDCGHGGDFDTLGYMFITSCLVSSGLCCWRFSRVAASKNRCWKKSECKIAGIKETRVGLPSWHDCKVTWCENCSRQEEGLVDRQGNKSWRWWNVRCPNLTDRRCWHMGKEEEGHYHGSAWGNGYKGKKKVWDVGFGQV